MLNIFKSIGLYFLLNMFITKNKDNVGGDFLVEYEKNVYLFKRGMGPNFGHKKNTEASYSHLPL